jgi:hypothetical protein
MGSFTERIGGRQTQLFEPAGGHPLCPLCDGQATQFSTVGRDSEILAASGRSHTSAVLIAQPDLSGPRPLQYLRPRLSDRHLFCYLAQHRDLSRGVPDIVIARTQPAGRHLEDIAKGDRFAERMPLE